MIILKLGTTLYNRNISITIFSKRIIRNYQIVMTDVGGWLAQNNLRWVKPLEKVFCSATFPLLCCLLLLGSLHKRQTKTEASKKKKSGRVFYSEQSRQLTWLLIRSQVAGLC